jgi:hypothetical protein
MKMEKKSSKWLFVLAGIPLLMFACDRNNEPLDYSSIVGIYTCNESSVHAGLRQYPVEIEKVHDAENRYIIVNFHNKGENEFLFSELTRDTLRINNQAISDISVNGKGMVASDFRSIQLNYVTDDGTTILDYYATFTR